MPQPVAKVGAPKKATRGKPTDSGSWCGYDSKSGLRDELERLCRSRREGQACVLTPRPQRSPVRRDRGFRSRSTPMRCSRLRAIHDLRARSWPSPLLLLDVLPPTMKAQVQRRLLAVFRTARLRLCARAADGHADDLFAAPVTAQVFAFSLARCRAADGRRIARVTRGLTRAWGELAIRTGAADRRAVRTYLGLSGARCTERRSRVRRARCARREREQRAQHRRKKYIRHSHGVTSYT